MHKLHAELASFGDDFETRSVELKYTGLDKQNEAQTHKQTEAIESEVVGADGLDLNLKNMTANTKDFSFLTKFMANFKQIKNVDIGKA